jgi:hydrogenase maturation protease
MLIIGLGNSDRGDDAAGPLVVHRLNEQNIPALVHAGSTLDLIELWTNADHVIIVDAVVSNAAPGTVQIWDANRIRSCKEVFRSSTHEMGLADAVELSRALGRSPAGLLIYGIEARQFGPATPPSPEVLAGIAETVGLIAAIAVRRVVQPVTAHATKVLN